MNYTCTDIAQMIDHSLLHPTLTDEDIVKDCELAKQYNVATVCIKPYSIDFVKNHLKKRKKSIKLNLGYYDYPDYESMAFWGDTKKLNTIIRKQK